MAIVQLLVDLTLENNAYSLLDTMGLSTISVQMQMQQKITIIHGALLELILMDILCPMHGDIVNQAAQQNLQVCFTTFSHHLMIHFCLHNIFIRTN